MSLSNATGKPGNVKQEKDKYQVYGFDPGVCPFMETLWNHYFLLRLLAPLLMLIGGLGCANEPTPPADPALWHFTSPDEQIPLPPNLHLSLLRAIAARNQLLIAADIGTGPGTTMVVLLCDPTLQHTQTLLSTKEQVTAIAASADGHYVAVGLENDSPNQEHNGSVELIDVETPTGPKVVSASIRISGFMDLQFSQKGHVLASTSVFGCGTRLWNLDRHQECEYSKGFYHIRFISSLGYLLCDRGEFIDLDSRNQFGCPKWSPRTLPGWDRLAFDHRTAVAFGGISGVGQYLLSGYRPSKVFAFRPADGSMIKKWVLPYPESEERIEELDVVNSQVLMISQRSRIVLHDTRSMKIIDVLQYASPSQFVTSAVYLPKEDAVYATNGESIWRWRLRGMRAR